MAHKKAAGTTKNGRDSGPQYLGVKLADGSEARIGSIIVRQRGTSIRAGSGTKLGRDYTIYSVRKGIVKFESKRKLHFDGKTLVKKVVSVS